MNVILIGFRGSGKTTVGRALAERLKREFIDCDEYIERRTQLSIAEIFSRHGESHFRTLESEALAELSALDGKVIATGGGAVLKYQNMQVFKRNGCRIFFLEVRTALPRTQSRKLDADPTAVLRQEMLVAELPALPEVLQVLLGIERRDHSDSSDQSSVIRDQQRRPAAKAISTAGAARNSPTAARRDEPPTTSAADQVPVVASRTAPSDRFSR
ncbi:MAG TPA: shikimate kinase [Planctomycetota bacterium]|nr:shikimate kinase [Planctomycetota bacterium]